MGYDITREPSQSFLIAIKYKRSAKRQPYKQAKRPKDVEKNDHEQRVTIFFKKKQVRMVGNLSSFHCSLIGGGRSAFGIFAYRHVSPIHWVEGRGGGREEEVHGDKITRRKMGEGRRREFNVFP